jgi:hypothetical protein
MNLEEFLKLKKTLKPSLLGKKNQKNPLGWFFFKNPGFFQPCLEEKFIFVGVLNVTDEKSRI